MMDPGHKGSMKLSENGAQGLSGYEARVLEIPDLVAVENGEFVISIKNQNTMATEYILTLSVRDLSVNARLLSLTDEEIRHTAFRLAEEIKLKQRAKQIGKMAILKGVSTHG